MVQINTLLKDIKLLLDEKATFVKNASLMMLLTAQDWSIQEKDSLSVNLKMTSNAKAISINRIKPEALEQEGGDIYDIMKKIFEAYRVQDSEYLLNLILDSIDVDIQERAYNSEIILLQPMFEQGHIYSMRHFKQILSFYKGALSDYSVDLIPWEKFISFDASSIDINYIDSELLGFILSIDKQEAQRMLANKPIINLGVVFEQDQVLLLDQLNIKTFVPIISCLVTIEVFNAVSMSKFTYNLASKRASDVIINTKY